MVEIFLISHEDVSVSLLQSAELIFVKKGGGCRSIWGENK